MFTDITVFDIIGVAGFALYVFNYAALTLKFLNPDNIAYFLLNAAAAGFVLLGLVGAFNLASALIQIFWIGISVVAIFIRLRLPVGDPTGEVEPLKTELTKRPKAQQLSV